MSTLTFCYIHTEIDGEEIAYLSNRQSHKYDFHGTIFGKLSFELHFSLCRSVTEMMKTSGAYYIKRDKSNLKINVRFRSNNVIFFEKTHQDNKSKIKEVFKEDGPHPDFVEKSSKTHSRKTY